MSTICAVWHRTTASNNNWLGPRLALTVGHDIGVNHGKWGIKRNTCLIDTPIRHHIFSANAPWTDDRPLESIG